MCQALQVLGPAVLGDVFSTGNTYDNMLCCNASFRDVCPL